MDTAEWRCNRANAGGLHVGDAYYLRAELTTDDHPVSAMAAQRADDDEQRRASLRELRRLFNDHGHEIELTGYHDLTELPELCRASVEAERTA